MRYNGRNSADTLHYLQKGGRIGRVQAMAGSLLNLKPVITVDKVPGAYVTVAKGRSMSKSIALIADQVRCLLLYLSTGKGNCHAS